MDKYKYKGVIKPAVNCDRFATPLFQKEDADDYYIPVEKTGAIQLFKKIRVTGQVIETDQEISVTEGDKMIYSFVTNDWQLHSGSREEMEEPLLKLISSETVNVHAKLLVSSFLKLYGKTIGFLEQSNRDLEEKGASISVSTDTAFRVSSIRDYLKVDIISSIFSRYEKYKSFNNTIEPDDIVFINKDSVYFNNYKLEISAILNKRSLELEKFNIFFSGIVSTCSKKMGVNIQQMITSGEEVYDFLLKSKNVDLDQDDIEKHLSDKAADLQHSILDIGILVDKMLYASENHPLTTAKKILPDSEKLLEQSMASIIQSASL